MKIDQQCTWPPQGAPHGLSWRCFAHTLCSSQVQTANCCCRHGWMRRLRVSGRTLCSQMLPQEMCVYVPPMTHPAHTALPHAGMKLAHPSAMHCLSHGTLLLCIDRRLWSAAHPSVPPQHGGGDASSVIGSAPWSRSGVGSSAGHCARGSPSGRVCQHLWLGGDTGRFRYRQGPR